MVNYISKYMLAVLFIGNGGVLVVFGIIIIISLLKGWALK